MPTIETLKDLEWHSNLICVLFKEKNNRHIHTHKLAIKLNCYF